MRRRPFSGRRVLTRRHSARGVSAPSVRRRADILATEHGRTGDLIVKVVNAQGATARTSVDLGGLKVASRARVTTLAADADADAVNTETDSPVTPVTSTFSGVSEKFTYTFPANSVTFLRIRQR